MFSSREKWERRSRTSKRNGRTFISRNAIVRRLDQSSSLFRGEATQSSRECKGAVQNRALGGRATAGIFRNSTVRPQLIESVPVNTIANLTNAGKAGS